MERFLVLAGQLFGILFIQAALELLASRRQNDPVLRPIELGCYLASLWAVLQFMGPYISDILQMIENFF